MEPVILSYEKWKSKTEDVSEEGPVVMQDIVCIDIDWMILVGLFEHSFRQATCFGISQAMPHNLSHRHLRVIIMMHCPEIPKTTSLPEWVFEKVFSHVVAAAGDRDEGEYRDEVRYEVDDLAAWPVRPPTKLRDSNVDGKT